MKAAVPKKKGRQKKTVLDSNGVNATKKSSVAFKSEAQAKKPLRLDLQAIFQEFQGGDSIEGKKSILGPAYRIFTRRSRKNYKLNPNTMYANN